LRCARSSSSSSCQVPTF